MSQHLHFSSAPWRGYARNRLGLLLLIASISRVDSEELAATNTQAASNGPRIQLAEDFFDFGRVQEGRIVQHDFAFTNSGNQVLEIQDVVTSCGCTTVGEWNRKVEPGKSGIIPIQLNTAGFAGPTLKNIKLNCNDPAQRTVALYLKVISYKEIDVLPPVAAFVFGPDFQTNQSRSIWITNHMSEPVTLEKPACTNQSFQVQLNTITEGKVFQLVVSVLPPVPEGSVTAPITIKTSSAKTPQIEVNAYALVKPSIAATPPRIFLDSGALKQSATFNVLIRNLGTNTLQLSDPTISSKDVAVRLAETEPGRSYSLTLTFPVGYRILQNQTVEARVKSNRATRPYVIIPVIQPEGADDSDAPDAKDTAGKDGSSGAAAAGKSSGLSPAAAGPIAGPSK